MRRTYRGRADTVIAVLSLLVVVSMILGMLISALPQRESQSPVPTATRVRATPTVVEPTPLPTPTPALPPTPAPQPTSS